ncbi:MAG: NfeD family protein [Spirochaetaceae bacterium]|jgi:membrane protein implicated in regulation of membrane protease activity|nr:NfeD family protein [Spirochaetaceae bacterium]
MDIYTVIFSPLFWLCLTILFTVIEVLCAFNLVTLWFAVSSLVMIFVSALTAGLLSVQTRFGLHIGMFLAIAVVLLIFTRPVAVKKLRVGREKTNVDDIVGRDAIVIKEIKKFENGEIKVNGQIWTAISENNGEIEAGAECAILKVEGVKVVVRKK